MWACLYRDIIQGSDQFSEGELVLCFLRILPRIHWSVCWSCYGFRIFLTKLSHDVCDVLCVWRAGVVVLVDVNAHREGECWRLDRYLGNPIGLSERLLDVTSPGAPMVPS